jgi:hypothetical protein
MKSSIRIPGRGRKKKEEEEENEEGRPFGVPGSAFERDG